MILPNNDKLPIFVPRAHASPTAVAFISHEVATETGPVTLTTWSIGPTFKEAVQAWRNRKLSRGITPTDIRCTARPRHDLSDA